MTASRASVHLAPRSPRTTLFTLAIIFFTFTLGCQSANSARGVVDRFIHQYYVIIDLRAAEPYCTGLALDKLHHEIELTAGQKIDSNTRKPTVHYKLKAQRDAPDHVEFLFRATIDVPEGGSFERNWMITARKDANAWKVSNFGEYE